MIIKSDEPPLQKELVETIINGKPQKVYKIIDRRYLDFLSQLDKTIQSIEFQAAYVIYEKYRRHADLNLHSLLEKARAFSAERKLRKEPNIDYLIQCLKADMDNNQTMIDTTQTNDNSPENPTQPSTGKDSGHAPSKRQKICHKCGGDGLEEIQSGPYFRKCRLCNGTGYRLV